MQALQVELIFVCRKKQLSLPFLNVLEMKETRNIKLVVSTINQLKIFL